MRALLSFSLLLFFCANCRAQDTIDLGGSKAILDTVYTGLNIPWEIREDQEGQLWITERHGLVSVIDAENKTRKVVLNLSQALYNQGEAGLLGMALHPNFSDNGLVYLVYTYGLLYPKEKLVRYTYDGDTLLNEEVILDSINATTNHNGSRLAFLPDGTLLMTTGDALVKPHSQDSTKLNGKVLRINDDGSEPTDNPLPGYIYSLGHRNAQGLLVHPNGKIYMSEHGPNTDDEFQIVLAGRNYGWPDVNGFCDLSSELDYCDSAKIVEPLYAWTPTVAVSDLDLYPYPNIADFENRILLTTLKRQRLFAIAMNESGDSVLDIQTYFINQFGRLRDVMVARDGSVYLLTNGPDAQNTQPFTHYIIRISPLEKVDRSSVQDRLLPEVQVFPNPGTGMISISGVRVSEIKVYNDHGALVYEGTGNQADLSLLGAGLYFIELHSSSGVFRKRFVLSR